MVEDSLMERPVKSQEALAKIVEGVKKFQAEVYPAQREMFESLKSRQQPIAMFITCADSRVVPNLFTQTGPGDIFIERNPGNLVPHYGEFVGGVSAGVEYGMLVLKVPLVIICGHTDCGVMKSLLHPEQGARPAGGAGMDAARVRGPAPHHARSQRRHGRGKAAPDHGVQRAGADREPEEPSQRAFAGHQRRGGDSRLGL